MNGRYERTPIGVLLDGAGLRLALLVCSIFFFILFWGARPASVTAGLALAALSLVLFRRGEKRRRAAREKRVRRAVGGACAMERLLLSARDEANGEVAALLALRYGFTAGRARDAGALCEIRGERVLVAFLQKHGSARVSAQDVLDFQRSAVREKAIRGVLALSAEPDEGARLQAQSAPRVTLFSKKTLAALLGDKHPATDAQLRRAFQMRRAERGRVTLKKLLARERAPRYVLYGSLLLLLYTLTGLPYYPAPGVLLVTLAALTRCVRPTNEEI